MEMKDADEKKIQMKRRMEIGNKALRGVFLFVALLFVVAGFPSGTAPGDAPDAQSSQDISQDMPSEEAFPDDYYKNVYDPDHALDWLNNPHNWGHSNFISRARENGYLDTPQFQAQAEVYLGSKLVFTGNDGEIAGEYITRVDFAGNENAVRIGHTFFSSDPRHIRDNTAKAAAFLQAKWDMPFTLDAFSDNFNYGHEGMLTNGGTTIDLDLYRGQEGVRGVRLIQDGICILTSRESCFHIAVDDEIGPTALAFDGQQFSFSDAEGRQNMVTPIFPSEDEGPPGSVSISRTADGTVTITGPIEGQLYINNQWVRYRNRAGNLELRENGDFTADNAYLLLNELLIDGAAERRGNDIHARAHGYTTKGNLLARETVVLDRLAGVRVVAQNDPITIHQNQYADFSLFNPATQPAPPPPGSTIPELTDEELQQLRSLRDAPSCPAPCRGEVWIKKEAGQVVITARGKGMQIGFTEPGDETGIPQLLQPQITMKDESARLDMIQQDTGQDTGNLRAEMHGRILYEDKEYKLLETFEEGAALRLDRQQGHPDDLLLLDCRGCPAEREIARVEKTILTTDRRSFQSRDAHALPITVQTDKEGLLRYHTSPRQWGELARSIGTENVAVMDRGFLMEMPCSGSSAPAGPCQLQVTASHGILQAFLQQGAAQMQIRPFGEEAGNEILIISDKNRQQMERFISSLREGDYGALRGLQFEKDDPQFPVLQMLVAEHIPIDISRMDDPAYGTAVEEALGNIQQELDDFSLFRQQLQEQHGIYLNSQGSCDPSRSRNDCSALDEALKGGDVLAFRWTAARIKALRIQQALAASLRQAGTLTADEQQAAEAGITEEIALWTDARENWQAAHEARVEQRQREVEQQQRTENVRANAGATDTAFQDDLAIAQNARASAAVNTRALEEVEAEIAKAERNLPELERIEAESEDATDARIKTVLETQENAIDPRDVDIDVKITDMRDRLLLLQERQQELGYDQMQISTYAPGLAAEWRDSHPHLAWRLAYESRDLELADGLAQETLQLDADRGKAQLARNALARQDLETSQQLAAQIDPSRGDLLDEVGADQVREVQRRIREQRREIDRLAAEKREEMTETLGYGFIGIAERVESAIDVQTAATVTHAAEIPSLRETRQAADFRGQEEILAERDQLRFLEAALDDALQQGITRPDAAFAHAETLGSDDAQRLGLGRLQYTPDGKLGEWTLPNVAGARENPAYLAARDEALGTATEESRQVYEQNAARRRVELEIARNRYLRGYAQNDIREYAEAYPNDPWGQEQIAYLEQRTEIGGLPVTVTAATQESLIGELTRPSILDIPGTGVGIGLGVRGLSKAAKVLRVARRVDTALDALQAGQEAARLERRLSTSSGFLTRPRYLTRDARLLGEAEQTAQLNVLRARSIGDQAAEQAAHTELQRVQTLRTARQAADQEVGGVTGIDLDLLSSRGREAAAQFRDAQRAYRQAVETRGIVHIDEEAAALVRAQDALEQATTTAQLRQRITQMFRSSAGAGQQEVAARVAAQAASARASRIAENFAQLEEDGVRFSTQTVDGRVVPHLDLQHVRPERVSAVQQRIDETNRILREAGVSDEQVGQWITRAEAQRSGTPQLANGRQVMRQLQSPRSQGALPPVTQRQAMDLALAETVPAARLERSSSEAISEAATIPRQYHQNLEAKVDDALVPGAGQRVEQIERIASELPAGEEVMIKEVINLRQRVPLEDEISSLDGRTILLVDASAPEGRTVTLGKKLGTGGYGTVYCLEKMQLDECQQVIKIPHRLPTAGDWSPVILRELQSEIAQAQRMDAAGIPVARIITTDPEARYLIKEYVPGDTAGQILQREPLTEEQIDSLADIYRKSLRHGIGLDLMHGNNLIWDGSRFVVVDPADSARLRGFAVVGNAFFPNDPPGFQRFVDQVFPEVERDAYVQALSRHLVNNPEQYAAFRRSVTSLNTEEVIERASRELDPVTLQQIKSSLRAGPTPTPSHARELPQEVIGMGIEVNIARRGDPPHFVRADAGAYQRRGRIEIIDSYDVVDEVRRGRDVPLEVLVQEELAALDSYASRIPSRLRARISCRSPCAVRVVDVTGEEIPLAELGVRYGDDGEDLLQQALRTDALVDEIATRNPDFSGLEATADELAEALGAGRGIRSPSGRTSPPLTLRDPAFHPPPEEIPIETVREVVMPEARIVVHEVIQEESGIVVRSGRNLYFVNDEGVFEVAVARTTLEEAGGVSFNPARGLGTSTEDLLSGPRIRIPFVEENPVVKQQLMDIFNEVRSGQREAKVLSGTEKQKRMFIEVAKDGIVSVHVSNGGLDDFFLNPHGTHQQYLKSVERAIHKNPVLLHLHRQFARRGISPPYTADSPPGIAPYFATGSYNDGTEAITYRLYANEEDLLRYARETGYAGSDIQGARRYVAENQVRVITSHESSHYAYQRYLTPAQRQRWRELVFESDDFGVQFGVQNTRATLEEIPDYRRSTGMSPGEYQEWIADEVFAHRMEFHAAVEPARLRAGTAYPASDAEINLLKEFGVLPDGYVPPGATRVEDIAVSRRAGLPTDQPEGAVCCAAVGGAAYIGVGGAACVPCAPGAGVGPMEMPPGMLPEELGGGSPQQTLRQSPPPSAGEIPSPGTITIDQKTRDAITALERPLPAEPGSVFVYHNTEVDLVDDIVESGGLRTEVTAVREHDAIIDSYAVRHLPIRLEEVGWTERGGGFFSRQRAVFAHADPFGGAYGPSLTPQSVRLKVRVNPDEVLVVSSSEPTVVAEELLRYGRMTESAKEAAQDYWKNAVTLREFRRFYYRESFSEYTGSLYVLNEDAVRAARAAGDTVPYLPRRIEAPEVIIPRDVPMSDLQVADAGEEVTAALGRDIREGIRGEGVDVERSIGGGAEAEIVVEPFPGTRSTGLPEATEIGMHTPEQISDLPSFIRTVTGEELPDEVVDRYWGPSFVEQYNAAPTPEVRQLMIENTRARVREFTQPQLDFRRRRVVEREDLSGLEYRLIILEDGTTTRLGDSIGSGTYGTVYCYNPDPPCRRVIKFPHGAAGAEALREEVDLAARLEEEGVRIARIDNPDPDAPYLIKEYIEGPQANEISQRSMTVEQRRSIANLLRQAREHGLHIDLKADNIVWSEREQRFILIDAGSGGIRTEYPELFRLDFFDEEPLAYVLFNLENVEIFSLRRGAVRYSLPGGDYVYQPGAGWHKVVRENPRFIDRLFGRTTEEIPVAMLHTGRIIEGREFEKDILVDVIKGKGTLEELGVPFHRDKYVPLEEIVAAESHRLDVPLHRARGAESVSLPAEQIARIDPSARELIEHAYRADPVATSAVVHEDVLRDVFREQTWDTLADLPVAFHERDFVKQKVIPFSDGRRRRLFFSAQERSVAEALGLIHENVRPSRLPRGKSYNYVVLDDGRMVFGQVDDALEAGASHIHLANGRPVRVAGQIRVSPDGRYSYNLLSGAYTLPIIQELGVAEDVLQQRVRQVFAADFGDEGTFLDEAFELEQLPSPDQLQELCTVASFARMNAALC